MAASKAAVKRKGGAKREKKSATRNDDDDGDDDDERAADNADDDGVSVDDAKDDDDGDDGDDDDDNDDDEEGNREVASDHDNDNGLDRARIEPRGAARTGVDDAPLEHKVPRADVFVAANRSATLLLSDGGVRRAPVRAPAAGADCGDVCGAARARRRAATTTRPPIDTHRVATRATTADPGAHAWRVGGGRGSGVTQNARQ